MPLSTSYDLILTRTDVVQAALELIGETPVGQAASAESADLAVRTLNMMLKHWQVEGLYIWKRQRRFLFLERNKRDYNLGATGDHWGQSLIVKTATAAANTGATSIVLSDVTGLANGYAVGIMLASGARFWTTISSIAGTTVNLGAALPADLISGAYVFAYSAKAQRPLKILQCNRIDPQGRSTTVTPVMRYDYQTYPNRTALGTVNTIYYNQRRRSIGEIEVYPTPSVSLDVLEVDVHEPFTLMDGSTNEFDFPEEWMLAITYNLAFLLSDGFGVDADTSAKIKEKAIAFKADCLDWDHEDTIQFVVD